MVPEGWKQSEVGDHVDLLSGFPFKSDQYSDDADDIRLLRGDNIGQGHLRWRDAKRWDRAQYDQLEKYHLKAGDFVIAMDRTWVTGGLKVAEVKEHDLPSLLLQRVSRLRAHGSLDQRLLRFFINGYHFEQYVKSVQTETAVPHISAKQIKEFPIPIPPLPEQRKIADILSTWDAAIEKTEALLATARTQKRALMQSLLTGRRRFPEFEGQPWREVRLGDVTKIIVSNVDKKSKDGELPVRLCNYMDVYKRDEIEPSQSFMEATATPAQIKKFRLKVDDVVITKDSEKADDIAMPTYVAEVADDLVCGYHLAIVRPGALVDGRFLKHYFELPYTRYYFGTRANGAIRFGLTIDGIEQAVLNLPPVEEQRRIASVIGRTEAEIASLATDITKLRTEKKALMQQLLTGKRRVTV
jgi:type I restriction enzyme S subunit